MNPASRFRLIFSLVLSIGLLAVSVLAAEQLYTCGMHPQIIKKEPGNCPICGMKLVPVRDRSPGGAAAPHSHEGKPTAGRTVKFYKSTMMAGEVSPKPGKDSMGMDMVPVYEDATDSSAASAIAIDARTVQRMNLKTAEVTHGPVRREIRTVGTIAYNEQGLRDITLKYEGWIEKLHVATTWSTVKAGEPLFDLYSPDLYNAELNFLVARRSEGETGGPLTRASVERLKLFDLSPDAIDELARTGVAQRTFTFRSPVDGVVVEKMAIAGQMMKPGERVYRIADLSSVWALAQIYEQDVPFVRVGQEALVRLSYGGATEISGKIELLVPQLDEQTRTITARLVLANPADALRPGMFVQVRLSAQVADDAVLVPDDAVLRSGERNTVFVALAEGSFEPRDVKLGARSEDNRYQVLSGLIAGERVVTSGQFMLDSESQLREAIQKMLNASSPSEPATPTDSPSPAPHASTANPTVDPAASDPLVALADQTADAAAALAKDDLARYREILPELRRALETYLRTAPAAGVGPLAKSRNALPDPADLKAARDEFEPISTAVVDVALKNHLQHREKLFAFECPMSPVLGNGRWLQKDDQLRNPFLGSLMSSCGEAIK
jgi:multidrug efflux pump subunit AcrA (membrane-fusion protein)